MKGLTVKPLGWIMLVLTLGAIIYFGVYRMVFKQSKSEGQGGIIRR